MRDAPGRALPAPRPIAPELPRIVMRFLVGPRSSEGVKAALTSKTAAVVSEVAATPQDPALLSSGRTG
jgi:hypothetical protein